MTVKHIKNINKDDGEDSNLLQPSDWNDDHVLTSPVVIVTADLAETPITGSIEYSGNRFYITNKNDQKAIDRTNDVTLETVTVANTTDEKTIWIGNVPANSLIVGNVNKFSADGIVSSASSSDTVTIRVKMGGSTKVTLVSEAKQLDDDHWHMAGTATQRTLGENGSRAMHMDLVVGDNGTDVSLLGTVNTTLSMNITVTVQWNNAKEGNTISLHQGFMEYKN